MQISSIYSILLFTILNKISASNFSILEKIFMQTETPFDLNYFLEQSLIYLVSNSNQTIIIEDVTLNEKCSNEVKKLFTDEGQYMLDQMIANSGKSASDDGSESNCILNNFTYLFFTYKLNSTVTFRNRNFKVFYKFLEQDIFFTGLCLIKECYDFYYHFFNSSINQQFLNKIDYDFGINYLNLTEINYLDEDGISIMEKTVWKDESKKKNYYTWIWALAIYFCLRLVITFLSYLMYNVDDQMKMIDNSEPTYQGVHSFNISVLFEKTVTFKETKILSLETETDDDHKKDFVFLFCKIFSLNKGMKFLFSTKSKYYDDTGLEIFRGYRLYLLFLLTLNQSIRTMVKLPHRYFSGYSFYNWICFFIIKYSNYACISFIVLNGIFLGFKLMNYNKNSGGVFSLKQLFSFCFKLIPSMFFFLFSFFFLHLFITELGYFLITDNMTNFQYYVSKHINSKECVNQPFSTIFTPFLLSYFTTGSDHAYISCFKFVYFLISELYCLIFFIILFYILNKIKSKKLDLTIFLINLLNLSLCYFNYDDSIDDSDYYTISRIMGETLTFQKPHIFIIPYFLGINLGVMWFYYCDLTTAMHISINYESYFPLSYNFHIMKYFDKKSNLFKFFLGTITIVLIILLCLNFTILTWINLKYGYAKDKYLIHFTFFIRLFYSYEGKFFLILEILFLKSVLFYNGDSFYKKLLGFKLFTPSNKISFIYFCSIDFIVYIFYSIYNSQVYMSVSNLNLTTLGLFIFIYGYSCITLILIELPIRMIVKIIPRLSKRKSNKLSSVKKIKDLML